MEGQIAALPKRDTPHIRNLRKLWSASLKGEPASEVITLAQARTLKVCRVLAADRDDMVEKAMSWALRELSKRDRPAVEVFVAQMASIWLRECAARSARSS